MIRLTHHEKQEIEHWYLFLEFSLSTCEFYAQTSELKSAEMEQFG